MQIKAGSNRRLSESGYSIVELMMSTFIFSLVATYMIGLYSLNTVEMSNLLNKGDAITAVGNSLERIGNVVRSARGFGDNYGVVKPSAAPMYDYSLLTSTNQAKQLGINTTAVTSSLVNGTAFLISQTFPSQGDPYYGGGTLPTAVYGGVWPWLTATLPGPTAYPQLGSPSGPGAPAAPGKYTLAQDTFVGQVPVFVGQNPGTATAAGLDPGQDTTKVQAPYIWPATWDGNAMTPNTPTMQAVDTYVFRTIPDSSNSGQYLLQEACFPANPQGATNPITGTTFNGHPTNCKLSQSLPTQLVSGIVGPRDSNGNIATFQYVEKVSNTSTRTPPGTYAVTGQPFLVTDYTGLIVDVEVMKNSQGVKASVNSYRAEFYARNNELIQLEGN